jgi:hypothetical protein
MPKGHQRTSDGNLPTYCFVFNNYTMYIIISFVHMPRSGIYYVYFKAKNVWLENMLIERFSIFNQAGLF